jgi:poly [ADP-ribose] polymerase
MYEISLELAKSNRSSCKVCKQKISAGKPRVGLPRNDEYGSIAWIHPACFNWQSHKVNSEQDLSGVAGWGDLPEASKKTLLRSLTQTRSPHPPPAKQPASAAASPTKSPVVAKPPAMAGAKRGASSADSTETKRQKALPGQLNEELPLSLGVSVIEYAKAKKPSPCMSCKGAIKNGEPRVGNRQESLFYEGIQTRWMHLSCAKHHVSRISQLEGWDRMGYDVNFEIRQKTGEIFSAAEELKLKTTMEALENVQDLLCSNLSFEELKAVLHLNGSNPDDLLISSDSIAMAVLISDYLAHGTPEDCPVCGSSALCFNAGRITCWGYVNGLSKCQYKASSCQRYQFLVPPGWGSAEWFLELRGQGGARGAGKAGKGGSGKGAKKAKAAKAAASGLTGGIDIQAMKASCTSTHGGLGLGFVQAGSSAPKSKPPLRTPPEEGSAVLRVHRGYEQTGRTRFAKIVVDDDGVTVYNANFTQTDLKTGVNRFYVVQLLQLSAPFSGYEIFCHWGRIGSKWEEEYFSKLRDSFQTYSFANKSEAIADFKKWFGKKTGNDWEQRHDFRTRPGLYGFVELSGVVNGGAQQEERGRSSTQPSSLDGRVAQLVKLLFDEDTILHSMRTADINLEEMPLGQVTLERVEQAKTVLARVSDLLSERPSSSVTTTQEVRIWESRLEAASTEYFRTIPSTNASLLDDSAKVFARLQVLDMLADIALAQRMSSKSKSVDDLAAELKCSITALPSSDMTFKSILESLKNTSEPAVDKGRLCGFVGNSSVELLEIFELDRMGEREAFAKHSDKSERQLLWHGTNIATAAAIVSSGLRIMGSGGRVGRGIYLADEANKSGHYVRTSQDGTGVMFLAEAALGKQFNVFKETSEVHALRQAPPGYDSVKAVGRGCPAGHVKLELDGRAVGFATGQATRVREDASSSFSQNEFLVYDESQVRLRYLVLVRLHALGLPQAQSHSVSKLAAVAGAPSSQGQNTVIIVD